MTVFVYKNGKAISAFEIANIDSRTEGVITDDFTTIKAKTGDRLLLASSSFEEYVYEVTSRDVSAGKIQIDIDNDIIDLEAVTVHQTVRNYPFMNSKKAMTPTERRLYAASYQKKSASEYADDFLQKGMVFGADPLINMISGRRKQLKKEHAASQKEGTASFLENGYTLYILDILEVPSSQLGLFIYFVAEKNKLLYKNTDKKLVQSLLRSYYLDFIKLNTEE
ncbi:hypothetical protein SAMN04487906_1511 [Zhouia amylolytica]|uniref:Uncharacterized protein n=1 Tax=Zhouia amylolytica TaxID=376730 RepID=A0A1I6SBA8_9FLAO|nr:hypothetical protein [Zhouia amylolytica]SFS74249.1 hypothetical protein SAMN04487906_1511 [Zhouia amylolytica]